MFNSSDLRTLLRRSASPSLRAAVRSWKGRLQGPSVFEVEVGSHSFHPETDEKARLTLVVPTTLRQQAYGGLVTGLDIFFSLAATLKQRLPIDIRILQTQPEDAEANSLVAEMASAQKIDPSEITIVNRFYKGSNLSVRKREIFMPYNWTCAANLLEPLAQQCAHFGGPARPLIYPIQEYEPNFYPMSSDQLLAREVYDADWPIYALVNSSQLEVWLNMLGHRFAKTLVFEPRLSSSLRPFLPLAVVGERERRILVYGRPNESRNCFPILRNGLQLWAKKFPEQSGWQVISAGAEHPPIPLGKGREVRSLGKLSMEDYAKVLSKCAIGISLMASPHPSYPPLEMAHFGLLTLTNRFANKDLSHAHENIISLSSANPEGLAEELATTCRSFEADPGAGPRGRSRLRDYLSEANSFDFMEALADDLVTFLS